MVQPGRHHVYACAWMTLSKCVQRWSATRRNAMIDNSKTVECECIIVPSALWLYLLDYPGTCQQGLGLRIQLTLRNEELLLVLLYMVSTD